MNVTSTPTYNFKLLIRLALDNDPNNTRSLGSCYVEGAVFETTKCAKHDVTCSQYLV